MFAMMLAVLMSMAEAAPVASAEESVGQMAARVTARLKEGSSLEVSERTPPDGRRLKLYQWHALFMCAGSNPVEIRVLEARDYTSIDNVRILRRALAVLVMVNDRKMYTIYDEGANGLVAYVLDGDIGPNGSAAQKERTPTMLDQVAYKQALACALGK